MENADPRIDRFLSGERPWRGEMLALRAILLSEGLTERLKWRQPCYEAHGGNVAIIGAHKDAAVLSFFKGVLLDDPDGRLELPGPNSRSSRCMRFSDVAGIEASEAAIRTFVRQAVENERTGRKVELPKDDIELPEELIDALDADRDFAAAFAALTPGRRRGWALHFSGARQSETRSGRIEKARDAILAGRGIHDR